MNNWCDFLKDIFGVNKKSKTNVKELHQMKLTEMSKDPV